MALPSLPPSAFVAPWDLPETKPTKHETPASAGETKTTGGETAAPVSFPGAVSAAKPASPFAPPVVSPCAETASGASQGGLPRGDGQTSQPSCGVAERPDTLRSFAAGAVRVFVDPFEAPAGPQEYLVLDIETSSADPDEAERWARNYWNANPRWTAATIGARYLEAIERKRERLALLDSSPIVAWSLRGPDLWLCMHTLSVDVAPRREGEAWVMGVADERTLLDGLKYVLCGPDGLGWHCGPETTLVGHNIASFDLPKLRRATLANGLLLPRPLGREQPIFDSRRKWAYFSLDKDVFVSLHDALTALSLPSHKQDLDGEKLRAVIERRDHVTLARYALLDVAAEESLFLKMSGRA